MSSETGAPYSSQIRKPWTLQSSADRVVEIPNGRVVSNLGLVVTPEGVLLEDLSGGNFSDDIDQSLSYNPRSLPPIVRLRGRALLMVSGLGQRNYYHWTAEMLPRLRLIKEMGIEFDHVIIPSRHRYHRESLVAFGIPASKLVSMRKFGHFQADSLIVTGKYRQELSAANSDFLYRSMAQQEWSKTKEPSRIHIYLARRKNVWRCVVNEAEALRAMAPHGFRRFYLEDLPLIRQIQLFQQADFVIGPHGSGLVNLVYCNAGTRVIEIGTPVKPSNLFHIISVHRSLRYENLLGKPVDSSVDDSHIDVDVKSLSAAIAR